MAAGRGSHKAPCKKIKYTREEALAVASRLSKTVRFGGLKTGGRAYKCPKCKKYHVTSMSYDTYRSSHNV